MKQSKGTIKLNATVKRKNDMVTLAGWPAMPNMILVKKSRMLTPTKARNMSKYDIKKILIGMTAAGSTIRGTMNQSARSFSSLSQNAR